ncbi:MAG TPA: hypothetical protein VGI81_24480 [Tepidisphaeraceae bacterium]
METGVEAADHMPCLGAADIAAEPILVDLARGKEADAHTATDHKSKSGGPDGHKPKQKLPARHGGAESRFQLNPRKLGNENADQESQYGTERRHQLGTWRANDDPSDATVPKLDRHVISGWPVTKTFTDQAHSECEEKG